jgi:aspartyl-tRNA(Asn)/glutamyl-tRNA(Gln) amidotransferase subunit B
MTYRLIVGLETHIQLNTNTKLFCRCLNAYSPNEPNSNICEFCTGQPGSLPILNKQAILKAMKLGVALGSNIPRMTTFDRKNYFYPDLPNGYQITQYSEPIVAGGELSFLVEDRDTGEYIEDKVIITRAHLETDAAKLIHSGGKTMVDFNRSGAPLLEIVTEPVIHSKETAAAYLTELQLLVRTLDVADADMEKGQMRCDCNISLQTAEEESKGDLPAYRVELKNINSIRALVRSIQYEIERQTKIRDEGNLPKQETRGWDDEAGRSLSQREKEHANDYRYFPEPDVPPVKISVEDIPSLDSLPELPHHRRARYRAQGLNLQQTMLFTSQKDVGDFFDQCYIIADPSESYDARSIANIISSNVLSAVSEDEVVSKVYSPKQIIDLTKYFENNSINNQSLAKALSLIRNNLEMSVDDVLSEHSLMQVNDESILEVFVDIVLQNNTSQVEQYRSGKEQVMGYLVGQCMKESKGRGNAAIFKDLLIQRIRA